MACSACGVAASVVLSLSAALAADSVPYDCSDTYESGLAVAGATVQQQQSSEGWTQERYEEAARIYREWYYHTTTIYPPTTTYTYTVTVTASFGSAEYVEASEASAASAGASAAAAGASSALEASPYWAAPKQQWCCLNKGIGCTSTSATRTRTATLTTTPLTTTLSNTATSTATSTITTTTGADMPYDPYDCVSGYVHWALLWSGAKKDWCCKQKGLGCFDCRKGRVRDWSTAKRDSCCKQDPTLCSPPSPPRALSKPFDCEAGLSNWKWGWSSVKTAWCCKHEGRGCATFAPPSAAPSTSSATTSPPPQEVMTCNLHCFGPGARPAPLPGSVGAGGGAFLPDVDIERCRQACRDSDTCEAVLFTNRTIGVPYGSMCYGKRDVHADKCQPGDTFVTEVISGQPWGKCAIFGDPHVLTFDRVYGPQLTQTNPGEFYLVQSRDLQIHGRFGYTKRFPKASSTTGVAVGGELIRGHTLVAAWVGPEQGHKGFKVWWDGKEILQEYNSNYESDDGVLQASYEAMDPSDFHREGRHTIGGTEGKLPSFYFQFEGGPNVYMLLGPDNCNLVIEARKSAWSQDGYCGNFNCDSLDDDVSKLIMRGMADTIPKNESLFRLGEPAPSWSMRARGPPPSVEKCDPTVRKRADEECREMPTKALVETCIFAACAAADAAEGAGDVEVIQSQVVTYSCHVDPWKAWHEDERKWCCARKGLGCKAGDRAAVRIMAFKKLFETPRRAVAAAVAIGRRHAHAFGLGLVLAAAMLVVRLSWRRRGGARAVANLPELLLTDANQALQARGRRGRPRGGSRADSALSELLRTDAEQGEREAVE